MNRRIVPKRRKRESLTDWLWRTMDRLIADGRPIDALWLANGILRIEALQTLRSIQTTSTILNPKAGEKRMDPNATLQLINQYLHEKWFEDHAPLRNALYDLHEWLSKGGCPLAEPPGLPQRPGVMRTLRDKPEQRRI